MTLFYVPETYDNSATATEVTAPAWPDFTTVEIKQADNTVPHVVNAEKGYHDTDDEEDTIWLKVTTGHPGASLVYIKGYWRDHATVDAFTSVPDICLPQYQVVYRRFDRLMFDDNLSGGDSTGTTASGWPLASTPGGRLRFSGFDEVVGYNWDVPDNEFVHSGQMDCYIRVKVPTGVDGADVGVIALASFPIPDISGTTWWQWGEGDDHEDSYQGHGYTYDPQPLPRISAPVEGVAMLIQHEHLSAQTMTRDNVYGYTPELGPFFYGGFARYRGMWDFGVYMYTGHTWIGYQMFAVSSQGLAAAVIQPYDWWMADPTATPYEAEVVQAAWNWIDKVAGARKLSASVDLEDFPPPDGSPDAIGTGLVYLNFTAADPNKLWALAAPGSDIWANDLFAFDLTTGETLFHQSMDDLGITMPEENVRTIVGMCDADDGVSLDILVWHDFPSGGDRRERFLLWRFNTVTEEITGTYWFCQFVSSSSLHQLRLLGRRPDGAYVLVRQPSFGVDIHHATKPGETHSSESQAYGYVGRGQNNPQPLGFDNSHCYIGRLNWHSDVEQYWVDESTQEEIYPAGNDEGDYFLEVIKYPLTLPEVPEWNQLTTEESRFEGGTMGGWTVVQGNAEVSTEWSSKPGGTHCLKVWGDPDDLDDITQIILRSPQLPPRLSLGTKAAAVIFKNMHGPAGGATYVDIRSRIYDADDNQLWTAASSTGQTHVDFPYENYRAMSGANLFSHQYSGTPAYEVIDFIINVYPEDEEDPGYALLDEISIGWPTHYEDDQDVPEYAFNLDKPFPDWHLAELGRDANLVSGNYYDEESYSFEGGTEGDWNTPDGTLSSSTDADLGTKSLRWDYTGDSVLYGPWLPIAGWNNYAHLSQRVKGSGDDVEVMYEWGDGSTADGNSRDDGQPFYWVNYAYNLDLENTTVLADSSWSDAFVNTWIMYPEYWEGATHFRVRLEVSPAGAGHVLVDQACGLKGTYETATYAPAFEPYYELDDSYWVAVSQGVVYPYPGNSGRWALFSPGTRLGGQLAFSRYYGPGNRGKPDLPGFGRWPAVAYERQASVGFHPRGGQRT